MEVDRVVECEYKGCENPASGSVWTEETGPDNPICVVCPFHQDLIQNASIQALAVAAKVTKVVWLIEPAYPGDKTTTQ